MSITIKTEELRNIVKIVIPAVKTDSLVEETGAIVFDGTYVLSYNDKKAISYPLPDNVGELTCGVSGKDFDTALKGIRTKEVNLSVNDEENFLRISGGKTSINLPLMNEEKLLELHDSLGLGDAEQQMKTLPKDFLHGLKLCEIVASGNLNNPQGLYTVSINKDIIRASDGFRVCKYCMAEKMPKSFIAKDFIEDVIKFSPVEYHFTPVWLYFQNIDGGIHCCRTSDVKDVYPQNMDDLFDCEEDFFTFPEELQDELETMSFFSEGVDAREKAVRVEIDKLGKMLLTSTSVKGDVTTNTSIEDYKGEEIEFNVSPVFLKILISEEGKVAVSERFIHMSTGPYTQIVSLR